MLATPFHPVVVLSTSGHNGVDWLHSLLDGHPELIILPAFSFMRTTEFLKKRIGKRKFKEFQVSLIAEELVQLLVTDPYQINRRQIFSAEGNEPKLFKDYLIEYLTELEDQWCLQRLYYGNHYTYAKVNCLDLHAKKVIVVQEQVPWHSEVYSDLFLARFLFIVRDPRAALAGAWIRQKRSENGRMSSYRFDHTVLYQRYFVWFLKFVEKRFADQADYYLYTLKNESLHQSFEREVTLLCNWLGVGVTDSIYKQTFAGREWHGESVYLAIDDLNQPPPTDYYEPSKVESRWRNAISDTEIKVIEWITSDIFVRFDYAKDSPYRAIHFRDFVGYFFLANNFVKSGQPSYILPFVYVRDVLRRICVHYFPNIVTRLFKII